MSEGRLAELMESLEADVEDTLPTLKLFQKGGVMHDELVDVLLAYAMYAATADGGLRPPKHVSGALLPLSTWSQR